MAERRPSAGYTRDSEERNGSMAEFDVIVRGGTIVDGTGAPRFVSDLAIKDGRIAQIGGLRRSQASKVLDASGLVVAPGFVDLHTHYDAQVQWDPYCSISGWHGVTTVMIGNCGFGFAPCREEDRERAMLTLTRNEAIPFEPMKLGMLWDWVSFGEFLDSMDRIPKGLNLATYVPLTPLYVWVMGLEAAKTRRPHGRRAGADVPACPPGDGDGRMRLVSPGPGSPLGATGLRRDPHDHGHDERPGAAGLRPCPGR